MIKRNSTPNKDGYPSSPGSQDERGSRESVAAQAATSRVEARLEDIAAAMMQYTKESREQFAKTNESLTQINKHLYAHDKRFDKIEDAHNRRFDQLEERMDGYDKRFDQIDEQFGQVNERLDVHDERFDQIDKQFGQVNERLDTHDERFDQIDKQLIQVNERLDAHDERFDQIDKQLVQVNERLDAHDKRFDQIDERLNKHDKRFDRLEERLDEHDRRFDQIDLRLDFLEDRIDHVEHDIKSLRSDFKSFQTATNTRFDSLDLDISRLSARTQNGRLRNPLLPLIPVNVWDLHRGLIIPDHALYPRNAREFFALEEGRTMRQKRMLSYLIKLYEVPLQPLDNFDPYEDEDSFLPLNTSSTSSGPSGESRLSGTPPLDLNEIDKGTRERAVGYLEHILGLDREQIERFEARAAEKRKQSPLGATKRIQEDRSSTPDRKRRNPALQESDKTSLSSPVREPHFSLRFHHEDLSRPTLPRPNADPNAKPSDWGTTTDAATLSRSNARPSDASE